MLFKLGTAILLISILSAASADEIVTYLIYTRADTGEIIQGTAFTDSDQWEVDGFVMLEHDKKTKFTGSWTRQGTIEAVDINGNMYMFDVVMVINNDQALTLTGIYLI
ncbi:MAG: hypothetical protein GKR92_01695 [Gammaproteobacteria bacterium]|nr:MAG: hypothetical protein GKR92_01695 [Gammaproteobacteria bacterium]